ncbi:Gfo/Idh/MocA family protein [Auraticoccus monumenti]|uniref:Oxidoreductase family, NAD-binding Rossmann fold n=1 Tax=Auraticoccus monumenti TaxID=675864 RepID=A0A1G6SZ86_9ACTN|nr:Gfo/Idh/MocA family oxidoreductase [Auraticoccus monumenti]SDD21527.1 Oxidoreductase family, NAD-binding Rossmann fold [Auraticoccus monumenti]
MPRERYGIIGTGSRAGMYIGAITGEHADKAELVAWSDTNPGRQDHYDAVVAAAGSPLPSRWAPADVEAMVAEERLDRVVVTSPDHTHAEYVSRVLLAGADVVVEKPLTIDAEGVRRIAAAVAESGRQVVTTFNYRYSPRNSSLKTLISEGRVGQVTSVHFEWVLDTAHGADYFRRWHRQKQNSGGLLVHKASHHFDLVNWWIDAHPTRVFASGGLRFYGRENAESRGLGPRPERGTGHAAGDPFALDLSQDARNKALYLDNEHHDGYLRDRDVFDEGIDIEDNLSLLVDYDNGATMSYSLNAHSPWEGYRVMVNGTEGRAELEVVERAAVVVGPESLGIVDPTATPADFGVDEVRPESERLLLQRHWERATEVEIPAGVGGHGGGDAYLLQHLFSRTTTDEPLHRVSGLEDGVAAVSVGIAGNRSLETGLPVVVAELDLR